MLAIVGAILAFVAAIGAVRLNTWNEGPSKQWWNRPTTLGWVAAFTATVGLIVCIVAVIQQHGNEERQQQALAAIMTKLEQVFPSTQAEVVHQSAKPANRRTGAHKATPSYQQEM
jgi:nicotinamide riboside transporter PnuC